MRPAARPIQILTLRERVESLMRAKLKAEMKAMMALLLRVRRRVAPRKSAGHTQGVLLRARCAARRVAMEKRKPSALGWRKSSSPRRRSCVTGRDQATMATRHEPETKPFMTAAAEFSGGPSRRRNQMVATSAAHAHQ